MSTHYVYRYFDEARQLLYVGCSKDPWSRYRSHKADSRRWIHEVARARLSVFPDSTTARAAEKQAIAAERPLYNRQFIDYSTWSADDFLVYSNAQLRIAPCPLSRYESLWFRDLEVAYASRFGARLPVSKPA